MRDVNYHELKTKDETIKWFEKNYGEFIANNNSNCYKKNTLGNSLFAYTGNMSGCYNEILELNKGSIDNIEKYIKQYYQEDNLNDTEQKILDIVAEDSERDIKLIYSAFDYNTIPQNIYLYH